MRTMVSILFVLLALAPRGHAQQRAAADAAVCAPEGVVQSRTTLYFGLARPKGTISEKQWKLFVREEITPRFPQGFTVWQADGQWRGADGQIARERAKVLLLVHAGTLSVRDALA